MDLRFDPNNKLGGLFSGKGKESEEVLESNMIFAQALEHVTNSNDYKMTFDTIFEEIKAEANTRLRRDREESAKACGMLDCIDLIKSKINIYIKQGEVAKVKLEKRRK